MQRTSKLLTGQLAELTDLDVHEVSLVSAGANGFPLLALKSAPPAKKDTKATPNWVAAGDRKLEVVGGAWDGAAAAARVFTWAGFDGDTPDPMKARRAFCLYDSANAELRGSYKLGYGDIVDGELVAIARGLSAARARINQVEDVPDSVIADAQGILDAYEENTTADKAIKLTLADKTKLRGKIDVLRRMLDEVDLATETAVEAEQSDDIAPIMAALGKALGLEPAAKAAPGPDLSPLLRQAADELAELTRAHKALVTRTQQRVGLPNSLLLEEPQPAAKSVRAFPIEYRGGKAIGASNDD
jgi:hypothetical protein